jgi:hypothetical protein
VIYFVTHYLVPTKKTKRKGMKVVPVFEHREYRTLKLTPMHPHIRNTYPGAYTCRCDTEIEWPFGVFSEIIAKAPEVVL